MRSHRMGIAIVLLFIAGCFSEGCIATDGSTRPAPSPARRQPDAVDTGWRLELPDGWTSENRVTKRGLTQIVTDGSNTVQFRFWSHLRPAGGVDAAPAELDRLAAPATPLGAPLPIRGADWRGVLRYYATGDAPPVLMVMAISETSAVVCEIDGAENDSDVVSRLLSRLRLDEQ